MKVKINITENGYSKTIKTKDGKEFTEKWIRSDGGFTQTQKIDESVALEETIDAIGSIDFDLGSICDALEVENAEIFDYGEEPITDDGHILKRGDVFWSVATTVIDKKWTYIPLKFKFPVDWGMQGSSCFFDRQKCVLECEQMNLQDQQ